MIVITIKRFTNKLLVITNDSEVLYQGEPADYTIVYNEEVPPASSGVATEEVK